METACFAPKARELDALSRGTLAAASSLENRFRGTLAALFRGFSRADCCFDYS